MVKYTVTVDYEGRSYQTNVIADHETTQEDILELALNQVKKQLHT